MSFRDTTPARAHLGSSLIEVLVALVVTSLGLLGMAEMVLMSGKVGESAYTHTQVSWAAMALIDSMHVNPVAVAQRRYDGVIRIGAMRTARDCRAYACNALERAEDDLVQFGRLLDAALPRGQAKLQCDTDTKTPGNYCHLDISWSERALTASGTDSGQTLAWVFQP